LEPAHRTDADLLRAVARGEREALSELYDRLAPQMLALARRTLGAQREAEDLIHDVFLAVWHRAAHYDHERTKVSTWLLLRVRSRALDSLRRARRSGAVELGESLPQQTPMDPHEANGVDAVREGRALHQVMADLPAEQRRVLELGFCGIHLRGDRCKARDPGRHGQVARVASHRPPALAAPSPSDR
jgi:RNA polymerase sigma-70 factor (ECF subfamily)